MLVAISILSVLLVIVLIAINPKRQFSQANDAKRSSDVNTILNAINQNMADNKGQLLAGIDATVRTIANDPLIPNNVDLCSALVTQYLAGLPVDPLTNNGAPVTNCTATYNTNYTVSRSASDNRITVAAPATEIGAIDISVTR